VLPVLVYMLTLTFVRRLVVVHKYKSFKEALEPQIPILSFKKWMPYDMLIFINEKWGKVARCISRKRIVYWPPLMTKEEGITSLTLL
jgi:hypothetical protein